MEKIVKHVDGNTHEHILSQTDAAIESAQEKGKEVWKKAKGFWKGANSMSRKTYSRTTGFIQKHPVQAVGYAVLFGLVVGAFLNSRKQD